MIRVVRALQPTLYYLLKAQALKLWKNHLPREQRNQYFKDWSHITLARLGVSYTAIGKPSRKPCLLMGNHQSYLDIPLLLSQAPVLFLAKAEIARWPLIGKTGRLIDTIFVDRSSKKSRQLSAKKVANHVLDKKEFIAIFPSGTTSIDENVMWREGAFRIAYENKIPVQAFRINYEPRKLSAFVGNDLLLPHMYKLLRSSKVKARIEFLPPRLIEDISKDMAEIKSWCTSV